MKLIIHITIKKSVLGLEKSGSIWSNKQNNIIRGQIELIIFTRNSILHSFCPLVYFLFILVFATLFQAESW